MGLTALVVGGTGPTGPAVVDGLIERGYEVTIFHRGTHEVGLDESVAHIHGSPYDLDGIQTALGSASFDVVVAAYGRLKHLASHFRGRTGHLVGIGSATGHWAQSDDDRWGPLGRPSVIPDGQSIPELDRSMSKRAYRIAEARRAVMEAHEQGGYLGTYIGYPLLYGPRHPLPLEWCIVRRILDGRRRLILPDDGVKLETRGYVDNVSQGPLLAIDHPEISGGKCYAVGDKHVYSARQWADYIAQLMGADLEVVNIPYEFATPGHPFVKHEQKHRVVTTEAIRTDLGYVDTVSPADGLRYTVQWLIVDEQRLRRDPAKQAGDKFNYAAEDELMDWWRSDMKRLQESFAFDVGDVHIPYRD